MFGRRYFGARHFGPRYFGGGSDVPPDVGEDIPLTARPAGRREATTVRAVRLSTGRRSGRLNNGTR